MRPATQTGRALHEVAWWAVAAAAAAAGLALFWRDGADSFRTTWEAAAAGAEAVRWSAGAVVWDEARGVIAPRSPLPFLVAERTGAVAGTAGWVLLLGLAWTGGTRRLALDLGAGRIAAAAAGISAGWLLFFVAGGHHAMLEAAAFPWLVAAVVRRGSPLSIAAPAVALGLLSPEGIRLAYPLILVDALLRRDGGGGRWLPAALGAATLFAVPEPEWSRFFRFEAPHAFTAGAYAWTGRSLRETLRVAVAGDASPGMAAGVASLVLVLAALAGMVRARRRGAAAGIVALAVAGVALGEAPGGALARPASVLALLFPAIRMHPVPDLAAGLLGPLLLALAARIPLAVAGAILCLVPVLAANVPAAAPPPAAPERIVAAIAARPGDVLALPLTLANDRRWRRALPGELALRNGTRGILAANAPVLARELEESDPGRVREILRRLGVARVVAAPGSAARLGTVVVRDEAEWLVRRAPGAPERGSSPCLSPATWTLQSSVGSAEVSVTARAVDGDPATRWGTGAPQRPGQFFEIDFGRVLSFERIELRHERFDTDFPRGFRVLVAGGDGIWREALSRDPYLGEPKWHGTFLYEVPDGTVRLPLGGRPARRLRIELTRPSRLHDWSIATICAIESAGAAAAGSGR